MTKIDQTELYKKLAQAKKNGEKELIELIRSLETLLGSVNSLKLFIDVITTTCFAPEGSISEVTHGDIPAKIESLAYHAYPFFGIPNSNDVTPWHINECIELLNKILSLRLIIPHLPDDSQQLNDLDHLLVSLQMQAEVVRGSAFPEQTTNEITSIQGKFDGWFARKTVITPTKAQSLLWSIIKIQEDKFNVALADIRIQSKEAGEQWKKVHQKPNDELNDEEKRILQFLKDEQSAIQFDFISRINNIAPDVIPVGFEDIKKVDPSTAYKEWEALIKLIGLTSDSRKLLSSPIDVRNTPLFVLPDNRVILVDISNGLDALWESFERVAKADQFFFDGEYQRKKSKWLEERVVICLSKFFPSHYIYQNLTYPDPNKNDGSNTELDVAIYWGPFLILIEAKAKQFRLESQLGDIGRLRTDIKANVEDAFQQAKRAAKYIEDARKPEFIESSTGRKLIINKNDIHRTYLVTVSQHLLAGLATRLSNFKSLGLFNKGEYPFSISIADLETIVNFCDGPDVFLHYIERRLAAQMESLEIKGDELDFFGAYLQTRLQPTRLWKGQTENPTSVLLHGFSSQFDDWYAYKRGDLTKPTEIKLEIPNEIGDILNELRKHDDYASRWIAFAILDLPDIVHNTIVRGLPEIRKVDRSDIFRRCTCVNGDTVISVLGGLNPPPLLLEQKIQMRTIIEKYRHKANKSIGLGINVYDKSKPFHCAIWVESPWEYDAELEKIMQDEPPFMPLPGTKIPGRNDPCLCGSGKKFKKCCLDKIEKISRRKK